MKKSSHITRSTQQKNKPRVTLSSKSQTPWPSPREREPASSVFLKSDVAPSGSMRSAFRRRDTRTTPRARLATQLAGDSPSPQGRGGVRGKERSKHQCARGAANACLNRPASRLSSARAKTHHEFKRYRAVERSSDPHFRRRHHGGLGHLRRASGLSRRGSAGGERFPAVQTGGLRAEAAVRHHYPSYFRPATNGGGQSGGLLVRFSTDANRTQRAFPHSGKLARAALPAVLRQAVVEP